MPATAVRQMLDKDRTWWPRWMQLNACSFLWPGGAYRLGYCKGKGKVAQVQLKSCTGRFNLEEGRQKPVLITYLYIIPAVCTKQVDKKLLTGSKSWQKKLPLALESSACQHYATESALTSCGPS
jgi:hypothetical protein